MSVETITAAAQTYAASVMSAATSGIASAQAAIERVGYTVFGFDPKDPPAAPTVPDELTLPVFTDIPLDLPTEPSTAIAFQDISAIELGTVPVFTDTAPTINLPNVPSALQAFTGQLPTITTDFVFPEVPSALNDLNITAPTVTDRAEPDKPTVSIPVFEGVLPTDIPDAPTDLRGTFDSAKAGEIGSATAMFSGLVESWINTYSPQLHTQMAAIESQLTVYLQGGTGFAPAVETAIYERERAKQSAEAARATDAAIKDAARRGHTLAPGSAAALVQRARQSAADNLAMSGREIAVKQADLEQANLQFALDRSIGLRKDLLQLSMQYHSNLVQINGQAIETARAIVSTLVQAYDVARQVFSLKLDAYRAEAQAYETRLRGAVALIDLYRAEIAALEALTNVDRTRVEVYRARVDSLQAFVTLYRAQIEAVQGRASLEKLKLDLFGEEVRAYDATVQAKQGEYEAYKASISGETAKVSLFEGQTRAFAARADGFRTVIGAKAEQVRAQATSNQAKADQVRAALAAYTAIVDARGKVATTQLENERQLVIAYEAATRAQVARFDMQLGYYKGVSTTLIENAKLSLDSIYRSAQVQQSFNGTLAHLATASAETSGKLAAAAVSSMNTLAAQTLTELPR